MKYKLISLSVKIQEYQLPITDFPNQCIIVSITDQGGYIFITDINYYITD